MLYIGVPIVACFELKGEDLVFPVSLDLSLGITLALVLSCGDIDFTNVNFKGESKQRGKAMRAHRGC